MGKRNLEALRQKHQSKFKKAQTKKPANSQSSFLSKWKTKEDQYIKPSAKLQEAQRGAEENQPRPSGSSPSKVVFPIESSSNELSDISSIEDRLWLPDKNIDFTITSHFGSTLNIKYTGSMDFKKSGIPPKSYHQ